MSSDKRPDDKTDLSDEELLEELGHIIQEAESRLDGPARRDPLSKRARLHELSLTVNDLVRELEEKSSAEIRLAEATDLANEVNTKFEDDASHERIEVSDALRAGVMDAITRKEKEKEEPIDFMWYGFAFVALYITFGAVPIILSLVGTNAYSLVSKEALAVSGTIGDTFGAANAFFAGGALLGAIGAIALQGRELRYQREELRMNREETRKNNIAQQGRLFYEQSYHRVRQTFELHSEFNSTDMMRQRTSADTIVRKNPSKTFEQMEDSGGWGDTYDCVWLVMSFYDKLYAAIKLGRVDQELVPMLFGEHFYWWYLVSFERQLKDVDWGVKENLDSLFKWFEAQPDLKLREIWRKRGQRDREKYLELEAISPPPESH